MENRAVRKMAEIVIRRDRRQKPGEDLARFCNFATADAIRIIDATRAEADAFAAELESLSSKAGKRVLRESLTIVYEILDLMRNGESMKPTNLMTGSRLSWMVLQRYIKTLVCLDLIAPLTTRNMRHRSGAFGALLGSSRNSRAESHGDGSGRTWTMFHITDRGRELLAHFDAIKAILIPEPEGPVQRKWEQAREEPVQR